MPDLTEERFRKILDQTLQKQLAPLATKQDLRDAVEESARITSSGFQHAEDRFDELAKGLDVHAQLQAFERKFKRLEEALHIKL